MVNKRRRQLTLLGEFLNRLISGSLWIWGIYACFLVGSTRASEELICGGFDMRNDPSEIWVLGKEVAERLKNCTVVEGDVRLVMLTKDNFTAADFPTFPMIREITGFLLVFQVYGLDSLGRVFPNLRTIRGNNLLLNYALTVYQNPNIREIGLHKLTEISRGGVRITENKELCSADLTNWHALCKEDELLHVVVRGNKNPNQCDFDCDEVPNADKYCMERTQKATTKNQPKYWCWNGTVCQEGECYRPGKDEACPGGCFGRSHDRKCCHDECVGGCDGPSDADCFACRNVFYGERCLKKCPDDMFLVKSRRCVTEQQCRERTPELLPSGFVYYKPIQGVCDVRCPPGHEEDLNDEMRCNKCKGKCRKHCLGGMIASLDDAKNLDGCNIVENLQIRVQSEVQGNVSAILSKYMKDIVEVKEYVVVSFSEALVSLDMLKSIKKIGGEKLYAEKQDGNGILQGYALSVFENANLVRLFVDSNHKLEIVRGDVQFHNNPLLCFKEITKFAADINVTLQKEDASARSNGNKAICEDVKIPVDLVMTDDEAAVLKWDGFNISSFLDIDDRRFLGFQVYHKELAEGEVPDMFKDRDACHDSWKMVFEGRERGVLLNELKPNTRYAVYVKTLIVHDSSAESSNMRGGISDIKVFKTLFGNPTQPIMKKIEATESSILLEWLPPLQPNGEITHYKIEWIGEKEEISTTRDYCANRPDYSEDRFDKHYVSDLPKSPAPKSGTGKNGGKSMFKKPQPGHCTEKECCECSSMQQSSNNQSSEVPDQKARRDREEQINFENALHNFVFQKNTKAKRNAARIRMQQRLLARRKKLLEKMEIRDFGDFSKRKKREIGSKADGLNSPELDKMSSFDENNTARVDPDAKYYVLRTKNVTGTKYRITGLKHFTLHQIKIWACQNTSVENNYCSRQEVLKLQRTKPITQNDSIPGKITAKNAPHSVTGFILSWKPPEDPNGKVFLYELLFTGANNHKIPGCITHQNFVKDKYTYRVKDLPPGNYSVQVRALTLAGDGPWSDCCSTYITVDSAGGIDKWIVILLCVAIPLVVLVLAAVVGRLLLRRNLHKHDAEYIMNIINTCPDYISTLDVYKPDQWELLRDDMELLGEIGEGTFGKVFAGRGKNIRSFCGEEFGDCAVKTVRTTAGHWDRLSFLMEASIMKQFTAAFIVKLYGVVSDGQPAFVVMEMMHKGNLRDYLRKRRPDDEMNTEDLPPPTLYETLVWAAQVADGMAYLESIKFCHRDLAARNCLVTNDGVCKIGDFGMTRDLYVKDYYRPTGKRLMPVRWMAPESLKDARFTSKSDIWSYGVVIWEMATLAQQPYAGLGNEEVYGFVVNNRKVMEKPTGCPDRLYRIMSDCWKYDPRDRVTFSDILESLIPDMDEHFRKISFACNRGDSDRPVSSSRLKNGLRSPSTDSQPKSIDSGAGGVGSTGTNPARQSPPNGVVPLAGSLGTDASDLADSDTPLNPADRLENISIDLPEQDSDGEELPSPICNSNRRGIIPKSYSTPNWARKSGGSSSSNSPRIDAARTVSNGPMANGHIPPVSV